LSAAVKLLSANTVSQIVGWSINRLLLFGLFAVSGAALNNDGEVAGPEGAEEEEEEEVIEREVEEFVGELRDEGGCVAEETWREEEEGLF